MGRESTGGARAAEQASTTQMKPKRAKITAAPDRDFSKGREAAGMKLRIKETKISEQQAGPLREYVKLMDELDEKQKVSTKGTPEQRKAALADIKEIASFIAENKKELKDAGLKIESLGLERKDNRKLLVRDRKDIFAPSQNVVQSGKPKEAPAMNYALSEDAIKDSARDVNDRITRAEEDKERALVQKILNEKPEAKPGLRIKGVGIIERNSPNVVRSYGKKEPVDGYLPRPNDAKGNAPSEFHKVVDADHDNVGKREVPAADKESNDELPRIVMPELQPLVEQPSKVVVEEDDTDRPTIVVPKPSFWQRNPVAAKVARWGAAIGAMTTAFLGYQFGGPKNDIDSPQGERISLAAPMSPESSEDSTISVSETPANVEISQPSAGDVPTAETSVTTPSADDAPDAPPPRVKHTRELKETIEKLLAGDYTLEDDNRRTPNHFKDLSRNGMIGREAAKTFNAESEEWQAAFWKKSMEQQNSIWRGMLDTAETKIIGEELRHSDI